MGSASENAPAAICTSFNWTLSCGVWPAALVCRRQTHKTSANTLSVAKASNPEVMCVFPVFSELTLTRRLVLPSSLYNAPHATGASPRPILGPELTPSAERNRDRDWEHLSASAQCSRKGDAPIPLDGPFDRDPPTLSPFG